MILVLYNIHVAEACGKTWKYSLFPLKSLSKIFPDVSDLHLILPPCKSDTLLSLPYCLSLIEALWFSDGPHASSPSIILDTASFLSLPLPYLM